MSGRNLDVTVPSSGFPEALMKHLHSVGYSVTIDDMLKGVDYHAGDFGLMGTVRTARRETVWITNRRRQL
jgi:hypothetical protein